MSLKEQLKSKLSLREDQFHVYQSDLYICPDSPEQYDMIIVALEELNTAKPETFFGAKGSEWEGIRCIDVPFGYFNEFTSKKLK